MKGVGKVNAEKRKMKKLKTKAVSLKRQLFEEITPFEYILWWLLRIALLYAVIFHPDPNERLMCFINMLACYAMTVIRFIAPKGSFISKLDFRTQHIINFFEFAGTFLGNYLDAYSYVHKYDRILHILSGIGTVIAGYYICKAITLKEGKEKNPSPLMSTFCGIGFSFVVIVMWEITEFIGDFLFGTQNQCFYYTPPQDDIWFKIFGNGALHGEGQLPLWDTMMDMIDASVATLVSAAVLFAVLTIMQKKRRTELEGRGNL